MLTSVDLTHDNAERMTGFKLQPRTYNSLWYKNIWVTNMDQNAKPE